MLDNWVQLTLFIVGFVGVVATLMPALHSPRWLAAYMVFGALAIGSCLWSMLGS